MSLVTAIPTGRSLVLAVLSLAPLAAGAQNAPGCQNWQAQVQANDPRAMAVVAGVWSSNSMMPGTPGVLPDTPVQARVTNNPNGAYAVDQYACFAPYGLQPSCATSMSYGEWTAHFTNDGWVAVAFHGRGSGFSGESLPESCGLNYWRQLDATTIVDHQGNRMTRMGG